MIPNPIQEHPASSKAPNEDFKDMDVLCTFKIKTEGQNLEQGCIKDQGPYPNQDQYSKQKSESPAPSKGSYENQKDIDVLCNFKIKTERQNLGHRCIKDQ